MPLNYPKALKQSSPTAACRLLSVVLLLSATPIAAQIERQHGAHVHGEATGTLAVDGSMINVQLDIPGHNLVGFEHPPRTDEQQRVLDQTIQALQTGAWLQFNDSAECALQSVSAMPLGFGHNDSDAGGHGSAVHDHEHDHDHDHNHDHDHEGHARFELTAAVVCGRPGSVQWAEIQLFSEFPNNALMAVDVLTARSAFQARLTPNAPRIDWP